MRTRSNRLFNNISRRVCFITGVFIILDALIPQLEIVFDVDGSCHLSGAVPFLVVEVEEELALAA